MEGKHTLVAAIAAHGFVGKATVLVDVFAGFGPSTFDLLIVVEKLVHALGALTNWGERMPASLSKQKASKHTNKTHPKATIDKHIDSYCLCHNLSWCSGQSTENPPMF